MPSCSRGVLMCEREPVVAELLRAALVIATRSVEPALDAVMERLRLWQGDARQLEPQCLAGVDVICLDPMFPARSKSAAVKKEMTLFQALLSHTDASQEASALMDWALAQDVARVVVKRPAKAPPLSQLAPSHSVRGKAVRYDVYVRRRIA
jgi:16S rRNA (guanine1516-N2)-methyltransferase